MDIESYASLGWHVFPCYSIVRGRCGCSKGISCTSPGKHPRTHNGVKDATTDTETIRGWKQRWPDSNWALACGRVSGVVVIDIDPRNGGYSSMDDFEADRLDGALPVTRRSSTGSGGKHLFFKYPSDTIGNRTNWLKGVDVKSDGGYVILPESNHISGGVYTWIDFETAPAVLPPDVVGSILNTAAGQSTRPDLPAYDNILDGVPEGQRDDTLFRIACKMRRQLGDGARRTIEMVITQAAAACDPPFPHDEAMKCVNSAFKQDHTDTTAEWAHITLDNGDTVYPRTDLGNARRFVDTYGDKVLYVDGWGWLVWSDTGWRRDTMGEIAAMTHEIHNVVAAEVRKMTDGGFETREIRKHISWINRTQSSGAMNAITSIAKDIDRIRRDATSFDANDYELSCRNGIVNLRTGELRPIDRDDLVTKNTGVMYDPDCDNSRWLQFLSDSLDGNEEMMEYVQRAAGYTLTGSNAEEVFFLLSGQPASGKSTFLDGLHSALGTYATTTQTDTFMYRRGQSAPPNELARLAGMRLVSMSELREGESFNELIIKQFTGGDRVTARFLYQDSFEYRPQFKLWIGTNHDPNTYDDAMWRRLKRVSFGKSVPEHKRDSSLKTYVRDPDTGGRAVLAWMVEGARKWAESGLKEPQSIRDDVSKYQREQDRPHMFIITCTETMPGAVVTANDLFTAYKLWCAQMTERPARQPQFIRMMESRDIVVETDASGRSVFRDIIIKTPEVTAGGLTWR